MNDPCDHDPTLNWPTGQHDGKVKLRVGRNMNWVWSKFLLRNLELMYNISLWVNRPWSIQNFWPVWPPDPMSIVCCMDLVWHVCVCVVVYSLSVVSNTTSGERQRMSRVWITYWRKSSIKRDQVSLDKFVNRPGLYLICVRVFIPSVLSRYELVSRASTPACKGF